MRVKHIRVLPLLSCALSHCGTSPAESTGDAAPPEGADGSPSVTAPETGDVGVPDAGATPDAWQGSDDSAVLDAASGGDAEAIQDAAPEGPQDTGPPAVRFVARVDRSNPAAPRFAWSGSTIFARFTGSTIGVRLGGPSNYYDIRIDGVLQPTPLATSPAKTDYPIASNLPPGPHELSVYRRTEAHWGGSGDSTFLGLILDPAGALLPPSPASPRRIEIVGDSTTCGYGDEGTNAGCGFSLAQENYDVTYGAVAARSLGADLITIAWSGKGIYRNYPGDMNETMPVLYGRTLPDLPSSTWDYASWIPDAVVINLGSNDFQVGDPGQPYVTTYKAFIARLRQYYPNALIVCAVGPKLSGQQLTIARGYLMNMVQALNAAGDAKIDFVELPQALPADGYGCGGHASKATHQRMGDTLAAELKAKLGW
jgi:lysophospholipase L1-like esterase